MNAIEPTCSSISLMNTNPGNYYVVFDLGTLPAGYVVTTQNAAGVSEDRNSDANPASGQTRTTGFLVSGSQDVNLDMGIYEPVQVGDLCGTT